jgi:hypothetical protein
MRAERVFLRTFWRARRGHNTMVLSRDLDSGDGCGRRGGLWAWRSVGRVVDVGKVGFDPACIPDVPFPT